MATRNFKNISAITTPKKMASRYDNMIDSVINMLSKEGPIYSTWIRFQIGKTDPLTFDSSSTTKKENIIAGLTFNKKGAGTVNDFELTIKYDPFDYGQNASDKIELLDELIASAMRADMDDSDKRLRGYIQYGYNVPDDTTLVSPKYEFFLTNAESEMDWSTGISEYRFEGTTMLAMDADFSTSIPEFKKNNSSSSSGNGVNLIDIVESVLWSYYGIESATPKNLVGDLKWHKNNYKYKIEVDEDLRKNAPEITTSAVSSQSPWIYCRDLLESHMSVSDDAKQKYKEEMTYKEVPHYTMYVTDEADNKTIHITYICPADSSADNVKINHVFEWGKEGVPDIVVKWNPQVDLRLYLIQKAANQRASEIKKEAGDNASDEFLEAVKNNYYRNAEVYEMYDAVLTTIGIPADIPLCAEFTIKPRILESDSRTAGIYMLQGCTDRISSNGLFISEIKLLRIRDIGAAPVSNKKAESKTTDKDTVDLTSETDKTNNTQEATVISQSPTSNADGSGGGFSSGGGGSGSYGGRRRSAEELDRIERK